MLKGAAKSSKEFSLAVAWSANSRTAKLAVQCTSNGKSILSDIITVAAGDTSTGGRAPHLVFEYSNPSQTLIPPSQSQITVKNTGNWDAANCSASVVSETGATAPSGVSIPQNSSFPLAQGTSQSISVSTTKDAAKKSFKVRVACDSNTAADSTVLKVSGVVLSFADLPSATVYAPYSKQIIVKNTGMGSSCSAAVVPVSSGFTPELIEVSPSNLNLDTGTSVTLSVSAKINGQTLPRSFKIRVSCQSGDSLETTPVSVLSGLKFDWGSSTGHSSAYSFGYFRPTIKNLGNAQALACKISLWNLCIYSGDCQNQHYDYWKKIYYWDQYPPAGHIDGTYQANSFSGLDQSFNLEPNETKSFDVTITRNFPYSLRIDCDGVFSGYANKTWNP